MAPLGRALLIVLAILVVGVAAAAAWPWPWTTVPAPDCSRYRHASTRRMCSHVAGKCAGPDALPLSQRQAALCRASATACLPVADLAADNVFKPPATYLNNVFGGPDAERCVAMLGRTSPATAAAVVGQAPEWVRNLATVSGRSLQRIANVAPLGAAWGRRVLEAIPDPRAKLVPPQF